MASPYGVVFPASVADFLANLVNICFGSMPTDLAASAAGPVVVDNVTAIPVQQLNFNLLTETHPHTS